MGMHGERDRADVLRSLAKVVALVAVLLGAALTMLGQRELGPAIALGGVAFLGALVLLRYLGDVVRGRR